MAVYARARHVLLLATLLCAQLSAQPGFGFGGRGFPQQRVQLLKQFDKDAKGWLNTAERKAARDYLRTLPRRSGRGGGMFTPGDTPGPKLAPKDVKSFTSEPLYDFQTLRTLFLEFEDADWEQELADFHHTDVDVPAKLTVDGKVYPAVGVHFRGQSSYSTVPEGRKRSLDVSMNLIDPEQRLLGYRSLNLLNSNADPTFLRTVLYQHIARQYIAAPKANYARVVINGESWGVYVNTQQINGDLTREWFNSAKGARWKVPGRPNARGGLAYIGDDPAAYRNSYEIKSKDDPASWAHLIHLCKILNQTPPAQLEKALAPLLDVDATLKWLALDKALINNDGYWTRASDYSIYEDPAGRFHLIPWDANETLREPERGGRGGSDYAAQGAQLDPFAGADDPEKALLLRLLAVPALRARYLGYIHDIARDWLVWSKIAPLAQQLQAVIAADVKTDARKLFSTDAFTKSLTQDNFEPGYGPTAPPAMSLKNFVEQRHAYLVKYAER